ncbi:MAG TPA: S-methyl-5-thioribose kinase [Chondromyces sp.]|nr:S-methyl-5-thioribose kinase [Chondromyces sp.]
MPAYRAFDEYTIKDYLMELGTIFDENAQLSSREIGDGNLNLVFHVQDTVSGKSVIVKQSLPYARVVGESMPLTITRNEMEARALEQQQTYCPEHTVKLLKHDRDLQLFVMEDLSDHIIMRKGLIAKNEYPHFAEHISSFMANTLFHTSDLYMDQLEKKELVKEFINPELCKITEDLVFTQPYYDAPENNIPEEIREEAEKIWQDTELQAEVAQLKYQFMTKAEALLHGDLHTGSIFVTETSTKVIDPEFVYVGPMGFDIGALLANLLLNYAAQEGWSETEEERREVRNRLLTMIEETWTKFEVKFRALMEQKTQDPMFSNTSFQVSFMKNVFADSLGYAGAKMIRRIYGLAHVADIDQIGDVSKRKQAQTLSLRIGRELIVARKRFNSIEEVRQFVEKQTAALTI